MQCQINKHCYKTCMFYTFQILFHSTLHANVVAKKKREAKSETTKKAISNQLNVWTKYKNNKQKFLVNCNVTLLLRVGETNNMLDVTQRIKVCWCLQVPYYNKLHKKFPGKNKVNILIKSKPKMQGLKTRSSKNQQRQRYFLQLISETREICISRKYIQEDLFSINKK